MKMKLYKAAFTDPRKPNNVSWSSSDRDVFIMSTNISDAAIKADREFEKWQAEDESRKNKVFESIKLLSDTIIA